MIRKIIHMADLHIRNYKMHDEYREAFKNTILKIKKLKTDNNLKKEEIRIVIAGDYVHQKITISNELLLLGVEFLKQLDEISDVVIIAGNHDLLERNKDRLDSITPMVNLIGSTGIKYYKKSECILDDNVVWCVYSIFDNNGRPDIENARIDYGEDKTYIGLYHAPINGASTDLGFKFEESQSVEHFENCDIVMMGDIHKRQKFIYKGSPIVYSSSLIQQNYGENISKHGFLFWDVDSRTYEECDIETDYGFYKFKIGPNNRIEDNNEILVNK